VQTDSFGLNFSHPNSIYQATAATASSTTTTTTTTSTTTTPSSKERTNKHNHVKENGGGEPVFKKPKKSGNGVLSPTGSPCALQGVELSPKWNDNVNDVFSLFSKSPKKD